jgi:hypothetical protein
MPDTGTPSDGDQLGRADYREAKSLLTHCHAHGVVPLVISVGSVRIELSEAPYIKPTSSRHAPPTAEDGNRLIREYGGSVLADALGEHESLSMEPTK